MVLPTSVGPVGSLTVLCICCIATSIWHTVGQLGSVASGDQRLESGNMEQLTVQETIALPFYHGVPHPWHLYKRSNPEAKAALYHILETDELERYHMSALLILGYVGDASDAQKMQDILFGYSGVLDTWQRSAATGIFFGLGIMSRRGIVEATEILDEMTSLDYWKQSDVRWFSEQPVRQLTPELEILSWVFQGQAIAEHSDLEQMRTKILKEIMQPQLRQSMAERIGQERTDRYVRNIRETEKKVPTESERTVLERLLATFSEHLEGVVDIEPETAEATTEQPAEEEWSVQDIGQVHELIRQGDASVLEILRRWLDESPEGTAGPEGRLLVATHGAGLFQDRTVLDKLRDLYQDESANPLVRDFAAEAISRMASEEELELLEEIMWNQRLTVSPRCEAAAALVRLDREEGRDFLMLKYDLFRLELRTRSAQYMGPAWRILTTMSDEKILAALEARLDNEGDERMRRNIITLREHMLINAKPVETLMVLAANPDWEERSRRYRAIDALGRQGGPELIPFLELLAPWEGENVPAGQEKLLQRRIEETIGKIRQRH